MPEKTSCKLEIGLLPPVRGTPFSFKVALSMSNKYGVTIVKKIDREMIYKLLLVKRRV